LMWQKEFSKTAWADAPRAAAAARTAGHADWRVPTIKELYSLMDFSGASGRSRPTQQGAPADARPYLNTDVFSFEYPSQGRYIDAQYVTSTAYLGQVMGGQAAFFGVNFADGRIKGYPQSGGPARRQWYARYVRGNPAYGKNDFVDHRDGTVEDRATGLTWTKDDSGKGLDWNQALDWCQGLSLAGRDDWRLPNAKELHSIVDYSRSPSATHSAAIDPVFNISAVKVEEGVDDWPFFWSSTSHLDGRNPGSFAVYVAFGRAFGYFSGMPAGTAPQGGPDAAAQSRRMQNAQMQSVVQGGQGMPFPPPAGMGMGPGMGPGMGMGMGPPPGMDGGRQDGLPPPGMAFAPGWSGGSGPMSGPPQSNADAPLTDVHGAGAQRSSPKSGDPSRLPKGAGPQGDVQRIYNYARCVRG
jgi:hypothetical protein